MVLLSCARLCRVADPVALGVQTPRQRRRSVRARLDNRYGKVRGAALLYAGYIREDRVSPRDFDTEALREHAPRVLDDRADAPSDELDPIEARPPFLLPLRLFEGGVLASRPLLDRWSRAQTSGLR